MVVWPKLENRSRLFRRRARGHDPNGRAVSIWSPAYRCRYSIGDIVQRDMVRERRAAWVAPACTV